MKLFKRLKFGKRKNIEEVSKRYEGEVLLPKLEKSEMHIRKYIVDGCETLTKEVQELTNNRNEYNTITNYLNDIQLIEGADAADIERLRDIASSIISLSESKNSLIEITSRMPESQYYDMDKFKEEIPQAIKRMKEYEAEQSVLKKDMDYLEGEKVEWTFEKNHLVKEIANLKRFALAGMFFLFLLLIFFVVAENALYMDVRTIGIIVLGVGAIGEMLMLVRLINDRTVLQQSTVNYNGAVVLQNKIKLKFVNITNAIEYAKEKYHVNSADDFEKQWETYLDVTKEKERLDRTTDDLEYYKEVMIKILNRYHLYDAGIWQFQVVALAEPKEMVEVKHELLERRTKIRQKIETQIKRLTTLKDDIYRTAQKNDVLTGDVKGILDSVDRIVNPNVGINHF